MVEPKFVIEDIGNACWAINESGRTVAYVTSQGYIDWLLRSPRHDGPLLHSLRKETHLCYTLGLKLMMIPPNIGGMACTLVEKKWELLDDGHRVKLTGISRTSDGNFETTTEAVLSLDATDSAYLWTCRSTIVCLAKNAVTINSLEFNNIYPGKCGRCFMFAAEKEYDRTLMLDQDGVVWSFPHQHMLHYSAKIDEIRFSEGTLAGFFGEKSGNPVVKIVKCSHTPHWAICDMFYDLHCLSLTPDPIQPGQPLEFEYVVKYLSDLESRKLVDRARPVPITVEDGIRHDYPRLELGKNSFLRRVDVGSPDDASGFRQVPPQKVWDRQTGHSEKGSLRIRNDRSEETVWSAEPPSQVPAQKTLQITARARTENVTGKGISIRIRYHTFVWYPTPHIEWTKTLQSESITGTTDGWAVITIPPLEVPEEEFDYLIWFDVVLDGKGVAWVTDVDLNLQDTTPQPEMEEGSSNRQVLAMSSHGSKSATEWGN